MHVIVRRFLTVLEEVFLSSRNPTNAVDGRRSTDSPEIKSALLTLCLAAVLSALLMDGEMIESDAVRSLDDLDKRGIVELTGKNP